MEDFQENFVVRDLKLSFDKVKKIQMVKIGSSIIEAASKRSSSQLLFIVLERLWASKRLCAGINRIISPPRKIKI